MHAISLIFLKTSSVMTVQRAQGFFVCTDNVVLLKMKLFGLRKFENEKNK